MIDSILIAESGLSGFEQGLRTISDNTANLNTPGFKGAVEQFSDMADGNATSNGSSFGQPGRGLDTLGTTLNFSAGTLQSTNNPLDLAINGDGFFTLRDAQGNLHYTQDGQFKFNDAGKLVSSVTGEDVMGMDAGHALAPISIAGLDTFAAQATSKVTFVGNLSSGATTDTVGSITVIDNAGTSHALSLTLVPDAATAGKWNLTLQDGATTVGTSSITFSNGQVVPANSTATFTYTPAGSTPVPLTFDFSANVTSSNSGSASTLAVSAADGFAAGQLTGKSFDSTGTLVLTYSNGQTSKKSQLALGQFASSDDVVATSHNEFSAKDGTSWKVGVAGGGGFGQIQSSTIEASNVDLSGEFSNLVIMQRGYQACSQVVSTASDMLTALFGMMTK